jgi:hypothetical protein
MHAALAAAQAFIGLQAMARQARGKKDTCDEEDSTCLHWIPSARPARERAATIPKD